jgi:hypothetical protein
MKLPNLMLEGLDVVAFKIRLTLKSGSDLKIWNTFFTQNKNKAYYKHRLDW